MIKIFLISILILAVTADGCRFNCRTNVPSKLLLCATDARVSSCHLLSQCQLRRENCNRRLLRQPLLAAVALNRCSNIKKPNSSGACAKIVRPWPTIRPNCRDLKCLDTTKTTSCYRSKANNCRLLTNCQMQHLNCQRGHLNRVEWVDQRRCAGLKAGHISKCKPTVQRDE